MGEIGARPALAHGLREGDFVMLSEPRLSTIPANDRPHAAAADALRFDLELPRLRAHARRLCACDADAHDLVQDTLLRALLYRHRFEQGSNLRAWLRQIQLSIFVSRYRRGRREKRALEKLAFDPCSWVHPEEAAPQATFGQGLELALRALPEGFRRAVELVDLEGLEYRDAAQALGVPIGTVMSRLHRGRKLLGRRLEQPRSHAEPVRDAA
jgi:RNA polymerase sigma-70 factor, ECF subfamily